MQESVLISEGFTLMLLGMGTVFVFLGLLVSMMYAIAFLLQRFTPLTPEDVANPLTSESSGPPEPLLAVISAAIHRHRQRNRR